MATQPEGQNCETCRYWWRMPNQTNALGQPRTDLGRCRRYPPHLQLPSYQQDTEVRAMTPVTLNEFWCGEYAPANPETVTEGAATMARLVLLGDLTVARALADHLKEGGS